MERELNERRDLPEINLDFKKTTIFGPSPPVKDSSPNSPSPSSRGLWFREENLRDWIGLISHFEQVQRGLLGVLDYLLEPSRSCSALHRSSTVITRSLSAMRLTRDSNAVPPWHRGSPRRALMASDTSF
jgi:hypothetical protein